MCVYVYMYIYMCVYIYIYGLPWCLNAGDAGLIAGLGRSPGEGNDNPLQYPCLENLMDRGAS